MNTLPFEYSYTPDQVRDFAEGESTLTPLERALLDEMDELHLEREEGVEYD